MPLCRHIIIIIIHYYYHLLFQHNDLNNSKRESEMNLLSRENGGGIFFFKGLRVLMASVHFIITSFKCFDIYITFKLFNSYFHTFCRYYICDYVYNYIQLLYIYIF